MATQKPNDASLRTTTTPSPVNATLTSTDATPAAAIDDLPSVEQRLAELRPSKELLEFYRQKIAEYDDEYSELLKRFENLNSAQEDAKKVEDELKVRCMMFWGWVLIVAFV